MSQPTRHARFAEDAVRRLAAAIRGAQLYTKGHPIVRRSLQGLAESLDYLLAERTTITFGIIGEEIIVGDAPVQRSAENYGELIRRLHTLGIGRIGFSRGVSIDALEQLVATLAAAEFSMASDDGVPALPPALAAIDNIVVGPLVLEGRHGGSGGGGGGDAGVAAMRRMYADAVGIAGTVWDTAQHEGRPDPHQAYQLVDNLAHGVAQNRPALIALTALKDFDNYTFTHMVNVSILLMSQARSLGMEGQQLREFGLAGLMHDIGKVRTPIEILTKPDRLTDDELVIMRMHVVDGAEILERTPEMPALAPVVAFEHHLRLDGGGYPKGVKRWGLNLATMMCTIADVYDALRSRRAYRDALPTDRILALLQKGEGVEFEIHLLRRFIQLMGIYPPGTLVELDTGQVAVSVKPHAPEPSKPTVRVITGPDGQPLPQPFDLHLWQPTPEGAEPIVVERAVDPVEVGVDPIAFL